MRRITRTAAAGFAAALAFAALAGCSSSVAPQSVNEACALVGDDAFDAQGEFAEAFSANTETDDVSTIAEALDSLSGTLVRLGEKVTNEEVASALAELDEGVTAMSDAVEGAESYSDITDAQAEAAAKANTTIQDAATRFAELCSAPSRPA